MNYEEYFNTYLHKLKESNNYRILRDIQKIDDKYVVYENKKYLNLSSNDYLGLATNKILYQEFYELLNADRMFHEFALSSSSSRLLTGNHPLYSALEQNLAQIYGNSHQALVFNSGYHANIGIIPAITSKDDLILSDKLNHASIMDGVKLSHAKLMRYPHLNYNKLEEILKQKRKQYEKVIIVSESVFSMDGDIADLKKLAQLKERYNCLLYIDEAHAVGAFGKDGLGICQEQKVVEKIDFIVGTFGKALASCGAYVICSKTLKEFLINTMRSLIFTTALPPINVFWNIFIIKKLSQFNEERLKLKNLATEFRNLLKKSGLNLKGETGIIPIIIGDNKKTIHLADQLMNAGFLIFAIRPPTVPPNSSRLRISLTANFNLSELQSIPELIRKNG